MAVGSVLWALLYGTVGFVGFHALRVVWEFSPLLCAIAVCLLLAASIGYVLYRRIRSRESAHSKTDQYVSESVAE